MSKGKGGNQDSYSQFSPLSNQLFLDKYAHGLGWVGFHISTTILSQTHMNIRTYKPRDHISPPGSDPLHFVAICNIRFTIKRKEVGRVDPAYFFCLSPMPNNTIKYVKGKSESSDQVQKPGMK